MYIKLTTSAAAEPSSSATCGMKMEHYCHLVLISMNQLLINHISGHHGNETEKQNLGILWKTRTQRNKQRTFPVTHQRLHAGMKLPQLNIQILKMLLLLLKPLKHAHIHTQEDSCFLIKAHDLQQHPSSRSSFPAPFRSSSPPCLLYSQRLTRSS